MTDLTNKWKKGELPEGWYYIKVDNKLANNPVITECVSDYNLSGKFIPDFYEYDDDKITEVLAPVPSYEEWQASYNCMLENEVLRLKNAQLKELLKECKDLIELMQAISGIKQIKFTVIDDFVKKINEVLNA